MFNTIKEFFFGKPAVQATPKVEEEINNTILPVADSQVVVTTAPVMAFDVAPQPVVETKLDPVAVALDLEPMDFPTVVPAVVKKPRKPRTLKVAVTPTAKSKTEKASIKKPNVIKLKTKKAK